MWIMLHVPLRGQINTYPYTENFDTLITPALPGGWRSSQQRTAGTNDFTSTSSSPNSSPNALVSTNGTIAQELISPTFSFVDADPDSISFYTRRSSTHLSPVLLEASLDGGASFPLTIGDTLWNVASSIYVRSAFALPELIGGSTAVVFRWRIIPTSTGSTGTFRIDDVAVTARVAHDLSIVSLEFFPKFPIADDEISALAIVVNTGTMDASVFSVELFLDSNDDSTAQMSELVASSTSLATIVPADSMTFTHLLGPLPSGSYALIGVVYLEQDRNRSNDTLVAPLSIGYPQGSLVINEIMYAPFAGNSEYVEFYNAGAGTMDLFGWTLSDAAGSDGKSNKAFLSNNSRLLNSGELFVLASDSSVLSFYPSLAGVDPRRISILGSTLSLNNEGDSLVLRDPAGSTIDSLHYRPSWHHPAVSDVTGRSLEKINPTLRSDDARSWSTCTLVIGGTPGLQNSVHTVTRSSASQLSFAPNPFSPDGDGYEDFVLVQFELPAEIATISISIFDVQGRLIRRLASNEPAGSHGGIVWDGRDDENLKARIGMYVVLLEASDLSGALLQTGKGVVVLAGRL
jgi:hypothetical protein